jgi:hypothetical protein
MNDIATQERLNSQRTNHVLHLILSVLTVGIWIPFWILITVSHSIERARLLRQVSKKGAE